MMLDDYNSLNEIWIELSQEVTELETQIQYNLRCIREAEAYLNTYLNSETEDYKVFSPRKAEVIYKEEIRDARNKITFHEEDNKELYEKKNIINDRMKKLETVLNRQNKNMTYLNVQEEDRQRIARELHDTSLQNLVHLIHKIELSSMYIDKDPIQAKFELAVIGKCLRETIDEIRGTIFNLRPMTFDDLSLKEAFEQLFLGINEGGRYEIIYNIDEITCNNNLILASIYRVVSESICNIEKHAEADKITFQCKESDGKCKLEISDNGKGFSEHHKSGDEKKHFGISLMKERVELLNGNIEIVSAKGKGTKISIEIPLTIVEN